MLYRKQTLKSLAQLEGEDLMMFINGAFSCTGQREFYQGGFEQQISIDFLHDYMLGNYRRLYALSLAAGINHYNQLKIVLNLLAAGSPDIRWQRQEEAELIHYCLNQLPVNRVLKLFVRLQQKRVNNRRTRGVIKSYLTSRKDPAFDAVKYRSKIKVIIRHAHLACEPELGHFLFSGNKKPGDFKTPLFNTFEQAKYSQKALFDLPYTVAEQFARQHKLSTKAFLKGIEPKLTKNERLRLQNRASGERKFNIDMDFKGIDLTRLVSYWMSLPKDKQIPLKARFTEAVEYHAKRLSKGTVVRKEHFALVIDRSYSMSGSSEKKQRPLAVALGLQQLLSKSAKSCKTFWSTPVAEPIHLTAKGQSNIAEPFIEALKSKPDTLIVVSDGYENSPSALTGQIYQAWRKLTRGRARTKVLHFNPVYDEDAFNVKAIGGGIDTLGIRNAEDFFTLYQYCCFATGGAPLKVLSNYLTGRLQELSNDEY